MKWVIIVAIALCACERVNEAQFQTMLNQHEQDSAIQPNSTPNRTMQVSTLPRIGPLRDPFHWVQMPSNRVESVKVRKKDFLETFPIEKLELVGVLSNSKHSWALIKAEGGVYPARIGQRMGLQEGLIVKIFMDRIEIHEPVPSGAETRHQSLVMHSSK